MTSKAFGLLILINIFCGFAYAANPTPEVVVLSGALGKEGDKFPSELTLLFEPLVISGGESSTPIAQNIKLIRIDLPEPKELTIETPSSFVDSFIKPDPRVALKRERDSLQNAKIGNDFSDAQASNIDQQNVNKGKITKDYPILFEVTEAPGDKQFSTIQDLLPELKKQIAKDIASEKATLKYAILYKLPVQKSSPIKPDEKSLVDSTSTPPPKKKEGSCTIEPIKTAKAPNWYAVIEIGSKGIKPIAVKFSNKNQQPEPIEFNNKFDTLDVTPSEEISMPRVIEAVCNTINQFHNLYGDLPVYLVGSSSMATVKHRTKLEQTLTDAIHLKIDFVTAKQEACNLGRGIWEAENMPKYRHCESAVIDIGSGNIKGGFIENCDRTVRKGKNEQFASFDIQKFGTHEFYAISQRNVDNKTYANFSDASMNTMDQLGVKLGDQIRTYPELSNNSKRYYLAGGAVWILNTLLCLDCPQYKHREENTNRQNVYTAIKPSDIDELYNYIKQTGKAVCDRDKDNNFVANPYLRRNMDGDYKEPWDDKRIETQEKAIEKVCAKFVAPDELLSAAEILLTLKNILGMNNESHIFFIQDTLYTWSRQYLIDQIKGSNNDCK
ncbi:MAG: hypothetical protein WCI11_14925 [Candidatus Methylumidiphilus sp.]